MDFDFPFSSICLNAVKPGIDGQDAIVWADLRSCFVRVSRMMALD
jgi:hypothetical protein